MKLYIEQRAFSFTDRFSVYNEQGDVVYTVKGEVFSLGKRLHLYDLSGNEIARVEQKVFSFCNHKYSFTLTVQAPSE